MEPTLRPGDKIDISLGKQPSRGRIVVLRTPPNVDGNYVIDRVVGLPGEAIAASDGHVSVNGRMLAEPWLAAGTKTNNFGPVDIPLASYFVMGDNRDDSADSRVYGPIPASSVTGVAFAIVYPLNRVKPLS
jgi:signal peptidase I